MKYFLSFNFSWSKLPTISLLSKHVLQVGNTNTQYVTKKELKGIEKEGDFSRKGKRTKIVKEGPMLPKKFGMYLISEKLGLKTKLDSIMFNYSKHEAYPIQAKYSYRPKAIYATQKNQLLMESLLIEDALGYSSPYGFIRFLKSGDLVKLNLGDKHNLLSMLSEIKHMVNNESFPKPTSYKKRCIDCCYKDKCWG